VNLKLDVCAYRPQRLPDATTGDTAANRVYLGDKGEDFLADVLRDELLVKKSAIIMMSLGAEGASAAIRIENSFGQQFVNVADPLVSRPSNSSNVRSDER